MSEQDEAARDAAIGAYLKTVDWDKGDPAPEDAYGSGFDAGAAHARAAAVDCIPVEERLPEFDRKILCCRDDGVMQVDRLRPPWSEYHEIWKRLYVAWMPLPEPYQAVAAEMKEAKGDVSK